MLNRIFFSRNQILINNLKNDEDAKKAGLISIYLTDKILLDFKKWLKSLKNSNISLDIETNHVDAYVGKILLISFYARDKDYDINSNNTNSRVLTFDDSIDITELVSTKELQEITIIAHNLKFESLWFIKNNIHFKKGYCTMLTEQKLMLGVDSKIVKHNLIAVLKRRKLTIPEYTDKIIREDFIAGNYILPEAKHILYNQDDTIQLINLKEIQDKYIDKYNLKFYLYNIHFPLIRTIAITELEGLVIDEIKLLELAQEAENKMKKITSSMENWIKSNYNSIDLSKLNKPLVELKERLAKQEDRLIERNEKNLQLYIKYTSNNKQHTKAYKVVSEALSKIAVNFRTLKEKQQEILINSNLNTISWTAGKQVIELLITLNTKPLPLKKDKKTKKFKPSLSKQSIEKWLLNNKSNKNYELLKLYGEFMKLTKHVNSFGKSFITKYKHPVTNKYHTNYKQGTVETGRLASGDSKSVPAKFNSQQLPPVIRCCFKTDPRYLIGTVDLSGAELIVICSLANDLKLLKLSQTEDLHSYFANLGWKAIYKSRNVEFKESDIISSINNPKLRRGYKPMLFGTIYGLRPPKAAETLNISEKEGSIAINTITNEIPDVFKKVNELISFGLSNGYIIHNTRTNSRRWFPAVLDELNTGVEMNFLDRISVEGALRNTCIQATVADILAESMVVFQRFIDLYKLDCKILMQVHDELVVKFHESYDKSWFSTRLKSILIRTANKYLINTVKMDAKVEISSSWEKPK